eukprot:1007221-Prorocentrum_minimum.AAC.1
MTTTTTTTMVDVKSLAKGRALPPFGVFYQESVKTPGRTVHSVYLKHWGAFRALAFGHKTQ